MILRIIFLLCIAIETGCSHDPRGGNERQKAGEIMDRVEELTPLAPDSALNLLYTIDKVSVVKQRERARYSLLHSVLLDKNYMDLTTDSIIRPAKEYYSRHGKRKERAKMYYYLGRIYENAGRIEDAVKAYIQSEEQVEEGQYNLKGLIYSSMGYLYNAQASTKEALDMFVKASDAFRKAGNLKNLSYTLREEGDVLMDMGEKASANRKLYEAMGIAEQLGDTTNILYLSLKIGANLVFNYKDIAQARFLLSGVYDRYLNGKIPEDDYFLWSYIYLQEKNTEKAEYYLQHRNLTNPDPLYLSGIYEVWRMLYEKKGEYQKALYYANRIIQLRDSTYVKEKEKLIQKLDRGNITMIYYV